MLLPNYSVTCHETVSGEGYLSGSGLNTYYFETAEELRVFLMNRIRNLFDEKDGHPIVDAEGKPILSREGYAAVERSYFTKGRMIGEKFFDMDDLPVLNNAGYAERKMELDPETEEDEQMNEAIRILKERIK